ncbi:MAG TPA: 23S rRNA (guanosine(2251)-2'-O)-methyltransferase RlmB [Anaerolineae bacterium]|nr:23S rRNA (guanosine(2251)-2'-O)-methyltransferase RlmB [Anaerolineae bacterium]
MARETLYRRNAVREVLRAGRRHMHRLWLQKGLDEATLAPFKELADALGVPVQYANKEKLAQLAQDKGHQGVVIEVGGYPYASIDEMLALARSRQEKPFLLLLDLVQGTQNVGSLLRTAEICGVHGVIIQDRRAPDINATIVNYSVGAVEHLLLAQVTNLQKTIQQLQQEEIWIAGLDMTPDAQPLGHIDLDRALALVVGHEGDGLRRLVRERCDFIVKIPMRGQVDSLNAAAAGAVMLYAAWQARGFNGAR